MSIIWTDDADEYLYDECIEDAKEPTPETDDESPACEAIRNYWLAKSAGGFFIE